MPSLKQQRDNLETIESIKLITQALADIATTQIKMKKKSVEQNIKYFGEINEVYHTVKLLAAVNHHSKLAPKNNRTARILLTSNNRFNGGLDDELTSFYIRDVGDQDCERIIVGSTGIALLQARNYDKPYQTIKLKRDFPTLEELKSLIEKIGSYSKVFVYHVKFLTLLSQEPTVTDVSETETEEDFNAHPVHFILEPEIDKMMMFFQNQIFTVLFQAIFLESDIARTAARMISMNQAEENAEKMLQQEKKALLRLKKQLLNRRILETVAGTKHHREEEASHL